MNRSYYELFIHIVWSTKNRHPLIHKTIEDDIRKIIKAKCLKFNTQIIAIGNTEDHLHLLVSINPNIKLAELIGEVKGSTSHFINQQTDKTLYWQDGYGALSVSKSGLEYVKRYVENQKKHHGTKQDLVEILERNEEC